MGYQASKYQISCEASAIRRYRTLVHLKLAEAIQHARTWDEGQMGAGPTFQASQMEHEGLGTGRQQRARHVAMSDAEEMVCLAYKQILRTPLVSESVP